MNGMRGSGPQTVEIASAAQRERAVRLLWLSHEFDTTTIAALLTISEAEVAGIVAKRDAVPVLGRRLA